MESYGRDLLTSDEMVKAARRQVLGREDVSASGEIVAAAHDRVSLNGADPGIADRASGVEYPAPMSGAAPESASMSEEWVPEVQSRRAPTRVDQTGRRQSQGAPPSPFEVAPRRIGRVGVLVGLALVGLAVVLLVSPNSEWFPTLGDNDASPPVVSASTVATTPGTMIVSVDTLLDRDHSGQIIIGSSDVNLDCAGHTITGSGQRVGIAVFDVNNVTVANCTVEGFEAAIVVLNSRRSAIEGNKMSDSPVGVVVMESSQISLVGNVVDTPDRGVRVINAHDSEIAANESLKSAVGFDVIDSTGNTFTMNRAVGSDFAGFSLTNADNNVFEANEVESSQFGFVVTASNDNTFDANAVSRGTGWFSFGFQERSEGNTVTNNDVTGGGLAFKVYIGSARNTFSDNTASGAAKGVSIDAGCVGNVVERNTITDAREIALQDTSRGGSGDLGTDNFYRANQCRDNATASEPRGLCES
jgi:parallel beta-helix repeat protein